MIIKDITKKYRKVYHNIFWSFLSILLAADGILPAFLFAQAGWGPDTQLVYLSGISWSPRAACSGDTAHVVWWQTYSQGTEVFYKHSTDAGESWIADIRLSEEDSLNSVLPWIAVNQSYVHVVWQQQDIGICYRKSIDGGNSWLSIDTLGGSGEPSIAVAQDNIYVVAYQSGGKIIFFKSTDNGNSWLIPQELSFIVPGRPRIETLCSNPNLLALIFECIPYAVEIFFIKSFDGGNTWIDSQYISQNDSISSQIPALATDDNGGIHTTWFDYKYSPYGGTGDIFYITSNDSGSTWEPVDSLTIQHRAVVSDILAESTNLHVVWMDDRNGFDDNFEIYYRMSTDGGQSWLNEERLTNAPHSSFEPTLACGHQYLHLFWSDARDGFGKLFYKRKDLSQGVSEICPLAYTIQPWFEICPTLTSNLVYIRLCIRDGAQYWRCISSTILHDLVVRIYDNTGKEVKVKWKNENEMVLIDISGLPCGVYFLMLQADKVNEVHKVVKVE